MKPLLRHLVRENAEEIQQNSLLNCHVRGLHSIMLLSSPGKSIRMFYAAVDHELGNNLPYILHQISTPMSLGIHPHRRNLTLMCLKGQFKNILFEAGALIDGTDPSLISFKKFRYRSKIKDGETSFVHEGDSLLRCSGSSDVRPGETATMKSTELHTVHVDKGSEAAWLVMEGREDSAYENVCYSNADLAAEKFDGMYVKPSVEQVREILAKVL